MLRILKAYDTPDELVNAIANLAYIGCIRTLRNVSSLSPDGETDWFEITAGVLQGETLAPHLFTIVLDYAMRQALKAHGNPDGFTVEPIERRRHLPITVSDLDFADDIELILSHIDEARRLLLSIENSAANVGLHLNAVKTQAIVHNQDPAVIKTKIRLNAVRTLADFGYLDSWIDESVKDMKTRKAQTWLTYNKLGKVWKSSLCRELKVKLFLTTKVFSFTAAKQKSKVMIPILESFTRH